RTRRHRARRSGRAGPPRARAIERIPRSAACAGDEALMAGSSTRGGNALTPAQIRLRIEDLGRWLHTLDLGGVSTAPDHFLGDYPRFKWAKFSQAIPADLRGRTVLDIGCNAGFYSIEMKRRGA